MNKLPACSREVPRKMNGLGRLFSNKSIDLIVVAQPTTSSPRSSRWGFSSQRMQSITMVARAAWAVAMGISTPACSHLGESGSREQDWKQGWDISSPQKPSLVTYFHQSVPSSSQTTPPAGGQVFKHMNTGSNCKEPHTTGFNPANTKARILPQLAFINNLVM